MFSNHTVTPSTTNDDHNLSPKIAVLGVGGAGCNAVNNMIASKLDGVDFIALNTDSQALKHSLAGKRIQLGANATRGLGAGSKPDVGCAAAQESIDEILEAIEGANMVFITAGMGGGTGTGAAPVIAKACKEADILTVGVVTKPFQFEGAHRMRTAEKGIEEIQDYVDTLIIIPNQNLFRIANEKTTFADAFRMADGVLQSGVRGITDLMVRPGLVNLDFADIRTAMVEWMGKAMMGTGEAEGDRRAIEAAERAINNPLLDDISMKGAKGVVVNITGGYDMTLFEVDEAVNRVRDEVDVDANIIFGTSLDESLKGSMRVTVLATGIETAGAARKTSGASQTAPAQQPVSQQQMAARQGVPMSPHLVVPQPGIMTMPAAPSYQPRVQTAPVPQQPAAPAEASRTATRMGGTFIPPKPVEVYEHPIAYQGVIEEEAMTLPFVEPAQSQQHQSMMMEPMLIDQPEAPAPHHPSALKLTPPTPGQSAAARAAAASTKKKSFSLFDKFAGLFSHSEEEDLSATKRGETTTRQGGNTSSGGGFGPSMSSMTAPQHQAAPVSGPLFGAMPAHAAMASAQDSSAAYSADPFGMHTAPQTGAVTTAGGSVLATRAQEQAQKDNSADLDIPAFLRRQIS